MRYWKLKDSERVIGVAIEVQLSPRWEIATEQEYLEYREKVRLGLVKVDVIIK